MLTTSSVVRFTWISFFLAVLSMTPRLSVAEQPAEGEKTATPATADGFVVVRLVTNAALVNVYFAKFDTLEIRSLGPRQKRYFVWPAMRHSDFFGPIQSAVTFGQKLPVGQYRIVRLSAGVVGSLSSEADLGDALPAFEISADSVTDLGVLVMQPVGKGKAVVFPVPGADRTQELLTHRFPSTERTWAGKPVIAWQAPDWTPQPFSFGEADAGLGLVVEMMNMKISADTRLGARPRWDNAKTPNDFHTLAKGATVALSRPAVAADGTMYFGSLLGQVLRRSPEGNWTNIETGRTGEISAVTLQGDELIAGTEDGEILKLAGGSASVIGRIGDAGRIVDVRHWPGEDWWIVSRQLQEKTTATHVYAGKSLGELAAVPSKSLSQPNMPPFFGTPKPFAVPVPGKAKYYLSVLDELHAYDATASVWTDLPQKKAPMLLANNDGSVLFSMQPAQFSADDGASWTAFKPNGALAALAFFDASNALAIFMTDRMTWSGTQEIRSTTDGGKTWTRVNELSKSPCDVRTVRQNDVQKRLFCVFRDGDIYSTGMQGEWFLERMTY